MSVAWEGLVADAVLGTERRLYRAPGIAGELGEVVAAAGDVLGAVSAVWAYEQVGRLPGVLGLPGGTAEEAVSPAAPDERPLLPAGAVRSLGAIVAEPRLRPLLGEWLQLAAADGRRLPPEWIPALLDLAPADRRPELDAAGGPRCAWLAAQRQTWSAGGTQRRGSTRTRPARPLEPAGPATAEEARRVLAAGAPPTPALIGVLPPDEAGAVLVDWLAGVHLGEAVAVLTGLTSPWPAALTDAVMAALAALVTSGDQSALAGAARDALPRFALAADARRAGAVAAAAGALEGLPDDRRPAARLFWGRAVAALSSMVHFRQAMQQEFAVR